jgi:hypothetical protein
MYCWRKSGCSVIDRRLTATERTPPPRRLPGVLFTRPLRYTTYGTANLKEKSPPFGRLSPFGNHTDSTVHHTTNALPFGSGNGEVAGRA